AGPSGGGLCDGSNRAPKRAATQVVLWHDGHHPVPGEKGPLMRQVLLLNATFEPLTTLSLRRAIVLVLREKADVIHRDRRGAVLRSASRTMDVPSVIRLYVHGRTVGHPTATVRPDPVSVP